MPPSKKAFAATRSGLSQAVTYHRAGTPWQGPARAKAQGQSVCCSSQPQANLDRQTVRHIWRGMLAVVVEGDQRVMLTYVCWRRRWIGGGGGGGVGDANQKVSDGSMIMHADSCSV